MMSDIEGIRLEEYRSLLEEHRKNRSYIFERPILILGIIAVAMPYFYGSTIGQFVLASLIFILCFNLWFIGHRFQSDARIVAYIQLVHEGELRHKWFGWESALREYRLLMTDLTKNPDLEESCLKEKINHKASSERSMFYPGIWVFHLVLVLLICAVTIVGWFSSKTLLASIGLGATLLTTIIFMIYAFGSFSPIRLKGSLELERATWICVFENLRGGEAQSTTSSNTA